MDLFGYHKNVSYIDQMDIQEIINRTSAPLEQGEMQFVVEQYIKDTKGVDVNIDLTKRIDRTYPPEYQTFLAQQQLQMLLTAFERACFYFASK